MAKKIAETPLMKQYLEMKKKHPDAILLFRVGDFYETFSDDAIQASEILGITLTRRANGSASHVELAGFPHHALDTYLPKLVRAGRRVAICEQLEDPKLTKKLVKRGITELVTPGVVLGENILQGRENNWLSAVHFGRTAVGVSFLDISTGEFLAAQGDFDKVGKLLASFAPKEVLVMTGNKRRFNDMFRGNWALFELDDWVFTAEAGMERLLRQLNAATLKGFGLEGMPEAIVAAGAALHYLDITQHTRTGHILSVRPVEDDRFVRLDRFTVRNLELLSPMAEGGKSLLSVLDRTVTPMGARMLRRWLQFPLKDAAAINERLDVVENFFKDPEMHEELIAQLEQVGDLERQMGRVAVGRVNPRELQQLKHALQALAPVKTMTMESAQPALQRLGERINTCDEVIADIGHSLLTDPASSPSKGPVIARGVDAELDRLRDIAGSGKEYLIQLQRREQERTGISSLKVGFNNVFGYYIEVTNAHKDKVPAEWIRKQTLVNAERYITPELKEYENLIMGAQEKIETIENDLYNQLVTRVGAHVEAIRGNAEVAALLDVLSAFATVARAYKYVRPVVDDSLDLEMVEARHPVIERQLPPGEPYVANTLRMSNGGTQIMMITGPNMAGKSALLRQTALNVLMAQIGCFVAADSAHIGVLDKVFTRVGASDNISSGESTFMVEMTEAASILNNMSKRSLIVFDELGRGTSTYDGISIARAIVEYLHEAPGINPKTLFATHYHELNEMEQTFSRIVNYSIAVKEIEGKVVFLRKLVKGGSEHSFGVHVAQLAGIPRSIVNRAEKILKHLEANAMKGAPGAVAPIDAGSGMQMTFFQLEDPVLEKLRDTILGLDINNLTPLEALTRLHDVRSILTGHPD